MTRQQFIHSPAGRHFSNEHDLSFDEQVYAFLLGIPTSGIAASYVGYTYWIWPNHFF